MQTKEETGTLWASFKHSLDGLISVIRNERNFRIHICMAVYVAAFSVIGKVGVPTFLKLLICIGAVMSAELFNSAIEILCDEITHDYNENIKKIKDISAAAVLVIALFSAILGLTVFLSKEVLFEIGRVFLSYPIVPILIFLSLPLAVLFIIKRGKK